MDSIFLELYKVFNAEPSIEGQRLELVVETKQAILSVYKEIWQNRLPVYRLSNWCKKADGESSKTIENLLKYLQQSGIIICEPSISSSESNDPQNLDIVFNTGSVLFCITKKILDERLFQAIVEEARDGDMLIIFAHMEYKIQVPSWLENIEKEHVVFELFEPKFKRNKIAILDEIYKRVDVIRTIDPLIAKPIRTDSWKQWNVEDVENWLLLNDCREISKK